MFQTFTTWIKGGDVIRVLDFIRISLIKINNKVFCCEAYRILNSTEKQLVEHWVEKRLNEVTFVSKNSKECFQFLDEAKLQKY